MVNANESTQIKASLSSVFIAVVVGFILIAIFVIWRRRRSGRHDFLLTGICASGKTALFAQLLYQKFPETVTSIIENVGEYGSGGKKTARVVDIPGHYKVRDKYFDTYKHTTKGIIFMIDSVTAQKEIRDVADVFHSIISDSATAPCSILVLCNKQDLATAKSAEVIRSMLEKEINIVRDTRSRGLQLTSEDDATKKTIYVGKKGRDFEFAHLQQSVQFSECSAKENELEALTSWLDKRL